MSGKALFFMSEYVVQVECAIGGIRERVCLSFVVRGVLHECAVGGIRERACFFFVVRGVSHECAVGGIRERTCFSFVVQGYRTNVRSEVFVVQGGTSRMCVLY